MPATALQNKGALLFVPNQGQTDEKARFIARTSGQQFYFMENGIAAVSYTREKGETANPRDLMHDPMHRRTPVSDAPICGTALFLTFEGATVTAPQGQKEAPSRFHYFTGNEPANWRTQLSSYEQLVYQNLWDGVDLTLAGGEGGLKFLWTLKEARSIGAIRVRYEGAEDIRVAEDGSLVIRHALGELVDPAPVAWQDMNGKKKPVACAYALEGNTVSFKLTGVYDASAPLTIDPLLSYSTYLGGNRFDIGRSVAVDSQGCAYIGGQTQSTNFPTTPGAFQTVSTGNTMAFLTKFAADGKTLVFSTYLGGSMSDTVCSGIALDAHFRACLTGYTSSTDFPTTPGVIQPSLSGTQDAFVTKVSVGGSSLIYSTYLGGSNNEYGLGIAVDSEGCAYVCGSTTSGNFPVTAGAFQTTLHGLQNAFVTKLSRDGTSLLYSTFFGGNDHTYSGNLALDSLGCAYITGNTNAANMPVTPDAFQTTLHGAYNAYAAKLEADGKSLIFSTYLGGSDYEYGSSIAVDEQYRVVIAGDTDSTDFPVTPGAFQQSYAGNRDAFVTVLAPDGGSLIGSTYLGGSGSDGTASAVTDSHGNVYIAGHTNSANFPITPQVVPSYWHGVVDAFVSVFSPDLSRLLVSYYLGGEGYDWGHGIALGPEGAIYVTGETESTNFPVTPGAFQTAKSGLMDAFAAKAGFALLKRASITMQETQ